MKELLAALGDLVALERLNRDKLAEKIGLSRPNMISAFSGRRAIALIRRGSIACRHVPGITTPLPSRRWPTVSQRFHCAFAGWCAAWGNWDMRAWP